MDNSSLRVTIYALPGCVRCRRFKLFLLQHGIPFSEVNVLAQPKALARIPLGYRLVLPVVVLGQQVLAGWTQKRLEFALRRRYPQVFGRQLRRVRRLLKKNV